MLRNGRPVADLLTMFDEGTKKGFLTRLCCYSLVAAENDIGAEYPQINYMKKKVLSSEKLHQSIQSTICLSENGQNTDVQEDVTLEKELQSRAHQFAEEMIGTVTSRVIRFCGWLYLLMLKQVCRAVHFSPEQIQTIQEVVESETPLIYMPLHFSHLDYILVSLILFHNRIRVPYIASGNNLHMPLFGYFIKRAGGFFIRRKLDGSNQKDLIYRAVLQTYVTELLKHGQSIEVFLEGTRSRGGLPNPPKTGLLSLLVDAVVDGHVPDALLVPVSISYEKLFEGNFNNELIGKPKMKESLWNTFKSVIKMICGKYGSIKVNFAKPISLKAALCEICTHPSCTDSILNTVHSPISNDTEQQQALDAFKSTREEVAWRRSISLLAERVVFKSLQCRSFMSTHIVCFLLLNRWRRGVTLNDLVASFTRLRAELVSRGCDIGFTGSSKDVVLHALGYLGPDIISLNYLSEEGNMKSSMTPRTITGSGDASDSMMEPSPIQDLSPDHHDSTDSGIFLFSEENPDVIPRRQTPTPPELLIKPILDLPVVFELAYYSNALTPLFALESIVCTSLIAVTGCRFSSLSRELNDNTAELYEDNFPERMRVSFLKSSVVEKALELCDVLQIDLILCDVTEDLENCIKDTVDDLVTSGCLTTETVGNRKITSGTYGIDEEENPSEDEWLRINLSSLTRIISYQSVLAPLVEGLAVFTEQLKILENPMPEKQFMSRVIDVACERSENDIATRVECCSKDILNHCKYAFKCNKVLELNDGVLSINPQFSRPNHMSHLLAKVCQYLM